MFFVLIQNSLFWIRKQYFQNGGGKNRVKQALWIHLFSVGTDLYRQHSARQKKRWYWALFFLDLCSTCVNVRPYAKFVQHPLNIQKLCVQDFKA